MRALGAALTLVVLLGACATPHPLPQEPAVKLPLLTGWYDGEPVFYITTDVSDAEVARDKGANFVPRLADALPAAGKAGPQPSSVDKVYGVTNFAQASVFASAPEPIGALNRDRVYSPLWQLVTVTWLPGQTPRTLKSEEQVLDAAEKGAVQLNVTRVVLNCPILQRASGGSLPGVSTGVR